MIIVVALLLMAINLTAQVPDGYYDSANGLTGTELKTALYDIIKGHVEFPYTDGSTDVWDILKETDRDPVNADNVILLYCGRSVNAEQEYNSGSGYSREHVWAKSRGNFGTEEGPGTDVHHLRPADISVNSARNNRWFDNCTEPYFDGGVATGSYTSGTNWVWKPREEVKGDVARMIFYMATRYEGENGEPDLAVINYFPSDKNTKKPVHAKLSALLQWHQEDPVDDKERNRNDVIYTYQQNRNPFIDHPEWVAEIWQVNSGENQIPSISGIEITPDKPANTDDVTVSATISDADGAIVEAKLFWGFASNGLNNEVDMAVVSAQVYDAVIPAQPQETDVYFKIFTKDSDNADTESDIQTYSVTESTNVNEENLQARVTVYPNPTQGMVYIKSQKKCEMELYTLEGKELYRTKSMTIDLSNYNSGPYLLKVVDREGNMIGKQIIIKL